MSAPRLSGRSVLGGSTHGASKRKREAMVFFMLLSLMCPLPQVQVVSENIELTLGLCFYVHVLYTQNALGPSSKFTEAPSTEHLSVSMLSISSWNIWE